MGRKPVMLDDDVFEIVQQCEADYRSHHPELDKVPLSKNKIIYEMGKYYLEK